MKTNAILTILLTLCVACNQAAKRLESKAKMERDRKARICGSVVDVYLSRGEMILQLKNKYEEYHLSNSQTKNTAVCLGDLGSFIMPGDSIFKDSLSDRFCVIRENKKYTFILNKTISAKPEILEEK